MNYGITVILVNTLLTVMFYVVYCPQTNANLGTFSTKATHRNRMTNRPSVTKKKTEI